MPRGLWWGLGVGYLIADILFHGVYYWTESRKLKKGEPDKYILIHGDFGDCTERMCATITDYATCGHRKLRVLIQYIESAKSTVDVSLYHVSNIELYKSLASCQGRGITVRIITDISSKESELVSDLKKLGIPVKITQSKEDIMHHKVIIIDGDTLLFGTFNWSFTALYNAESVCVSTHPETLQDFRSEFNRLWKQIP